MAAPYLDTSLIVAALTAEPLTKIAQPYLSTAWPEGPVLSAWTTTEVSAALSMKTRVGALAESERQAALATFRRFLRDSFICLPVVGDDFVAAANLADRPSVALRAGDALHLAVALRAGLVVHTLDHVMARDAQRLDIPCQLVTPS